MNKSGIDTSSLGQYQFLSGGGEMGALTRAKDWSKTPAGPVKGWPQSLRTTLGIILNSKFPMFLWWGHELVCFYNDAYRPSLGQNGKHPAILGMPAAEAWPEIWTIIKPLIDQVLGGGEATWSEDQLIPIFRNGRIEDVYWTFSYSPVNDESGKVAGVLVTCSETTNKVKTFKSLEESNRRYLYNIIQAPVAMCILRGKNHVVEIANELMLEVWGKTAEQVMSKPLFEGLPEAKGQGFESLLDHVYNTGEKFVANERPVNLPRNGKLATTYINFVYEALSEPDGTISGIVAIASDVSLQVMARNRVGDAEERLRLATEASGLSTWDLDLQTQEIIHSSRLAEIFGHDKLKKLSSSEISSQIHPGDIHDIVEKAFDEAMLTGIYYYQSRIIHPDKTIHWIRTHGKVIFDDKNIPLRMLGTIMDITDTQVAKEKIAATAAIVQSSDDAIISKSLDGIITTWNNAAERIFGYAADEMIGQPIFILIPPDRIHEEPDILAQLRKGQRVDHFETKRITKDGRILDISLTISPVRDVEGNIIGASKIARDITSQKEKELLIIASEQKFRLLADSMPQFVWTGDAEGNLNYFNQSVFDYSGITPEQMNKDGWIQIVHPDDKEENIRAWTNSVTTGKDFLFEHRFRRYDGEYRWQLSRAIPQRDAAGNIQMWVGTSTDIQEIKELDQQKDFFLSMASHELKTPITSIKGYAQMLQGMYSNSEDVFLKNSLRVIDKQIEKLTNLISDLLDVSKIKSGNLVLVKENFPVSDLIREAIDEIEHINPDYTFLFIEEKEMVIHADRERIGQVLRNFFTNAVKYSPATRTVKVKSLIRDNSITISVEDSGIGISKKDQEKIFERFYRVEGKNEKTYPGFGIGLFISAEIVQRHNGKIGVESKPGKGSVFYFTLPLTTAH